MGKLPGKLVKRDARGLLLVTRLQQVGTHAPPFLLRARERGELLDEHVEERCVATLPLVQAPAKERQRRAELRSRSRDQDQRAVFSPSR